MKTDYRTRTLLGRDLSGYNEPSREQVTAALDRVWQEIEPRAAHTTRITEASAPRRKPQVLKTSTPRSLAVAAALLAASVGTAIVWRPADDSLFRLAEGNVYRQDGAIRANGGSGAVLALLDGSRVEMRSNTDLSLERADDGLRIRLNTGGIIVNAAKRRTGHLYVQTKDVTVSVVGTVFLVNTESRGSRVAVIEGEVRVEQGGTEHRLRQGEQVASDPSMPSLPVKEEVAWSRQADAHVALLKQSVAGSAPPPPPVKNLFELASVRLNRSAATGGRGGGALPACIAVPFFQVDPRRFAAASNLFTLIVRAYTNHNCMYVERYAEDLLAGAAAWVKNDSFMIEALIPEGNTAGQQYLDGDRTKLHEMLQALLEDRFRLVVRRTQKEMPIYILKQTEGGSKLTPPREEEPRRGGYGFGTPPPSPGTLRPPGQRPPITTLHLFFGNKVTSAGIADLLSMRLQRPVLNRTGLSGEFAFRMEYLPGEGDNSYLQYKDSGLTGPTIFDALEQQLGLTLEATKAPIEVMVIERAERPTEN